MKSDSAASAPRGTRWQVAVRRAHGGAVVALTRCCMAQRVRGLVRPQFPNHIGRRISSGALVAPDPGATGSPAGTRIVLVNGVM